MYQIGEAHGIQLFAPNDAYFSYFNSPYFSHSHASAIDVYPSHKEWGGPVLSPIAGRIVKVKKTKMGKKKNFPTQEYDFGIAIEPESKEDIIVRLLHCKPTLNVGSKVGRGDMIGKTIRSRYFNYWTGPHFHVEVMRKEFFSRSTQSFPLKIPFRYQARLESNLLKESEITITSVSKDNIIGYPKNFSHTDIGSYTGLSATDSQSNILGIIDGGISHYKHGGVVGHENATACSVVGVQNIPVGMIQESLTDGSYFSRGPAVKSYLDDRKLRGLSCFVYPKAYCKQGVSPLVLVPSTYGEFTDLLSDGDVCFLKLVRENDTNITKDR